MGEAKRKLSRDATTDEIFPGGHGPVQSQLSDLLPAIMDALKEGIPGFDFALFVMECEEAVPPGEPRLPRFNYISTVDRRDMVACLKAFIEKNENEWAAKLDRIQDPPPSGRPQ